MRILPNRTVSLYGNIPYIFQKQVMKWEYRSNYKNSKFLLVDDKDGHLGLCALRKNIPIVMYETDKILIKGGKYNVPINIPNTENYTFVNRTILGFEDRVANELLKSKYKVINKSYYDVVDQNKYEYVTACRSLHLESNNKYSLDEKVNKLKSNVKDGGYLYIEYYIANNNDEEKYPKNSYFKADEMINYFPNNEWEIIVNDIKTEQEPISPNSIMKENIIVGYLNVRKRNNNYASETVKSNKRKRTKKIILDINYNEHRVNHAYTINGVVR